MTKLSDAQLVVLSAATQRPDRNLLPLPANLKGGPASRIVASLIGKGFVEEDASVPGAPVWRTDADGRKFTLFATDTAFQALGIEMEAASHDNEADARAQAANGGDGADGETAEANPPEAAPVSRKTGKTRKARIDTKQAQLIAMLKQPDGASLTEIVAATGWQAHTVRGAIAGALKKKLGLEIASEKVEGRGRIYRVVG